MLRTHLQIRSRRDAEAFFRGELGDVDVPTAPFDLVDIRCDGHDIEEGHQILDPILAQSLRMQARALRVSSAALFHVAWALVVAATSNRDDVVFGTLLSGRSRADAAAGRIFGTTVNTLPLRVRIRGSAVGELVERMHRDLARLMRYENVPLTLAQDCSAVGADGPLFSTLFNYVHSSVGFSELHAPGIDISIGRERTNFPITLAVLDQGNGFALHAQVDRKVGPQRVLNYFVAALSSLVRAVKTDPGSRASTLAILPDAERQSVLTTFNANRLSFPETVRIESLFEAQSRCTPEVSAVVFEGQSLTYADLNCRANQLARLLRQLHADGPRLVGLCFERGLDLVVAWLATLKAGAAYVPLDPQYPAERLGFMLSDAAPQVVLTQAHLMGIFPPSKAQFLALDSNGRFPHNRPVPPIFRSGIDLRTDYFDPERRVGFFQLAKHPVVPERARHGAAGTRKVRRRSHRASGLNHLQVTRADGVNFGAQVEIRVDQFAQRGNIAIEQRAPPAFGIACPLLHCTAHLHVSRIPSLPDVGMKNFRPFAQAGSIRQVHVRQQRRVQPLIFANPKRIHQILGEIHVHQPFVDLDHAVLRTGRYAQFPGLRLQRELGLHGGRNFHRIVLAQRAQRRDDDRARPAHAQAQRNGGLVLDGKIPVRQLNPLLAAIIHEAHDQRLNNADASVVAAPARVGVQILQAFEHRHIGLRRRDLQARRGIEQNAGAEIPHQKGNRFSEISVARVPQQPGPRVRVGFDHIAILQSAKGAARTARL